MPKSRFFYLVNMSFKAVRENKILAKNSEFTVLSVAAFREMILSYLTFWQYEISFT